MTRSTSGPNNRRTDAVTSGDTNRPAGRANDRTGGRRRAEDAPPEDEVRDDLRGRPARRRGGRRRPDRRGRRRRPRRARTTPARGAAAGSTRSTAATAASTSSGARRPGTRSSASSLLDLPPVDGLPGLQLRHRLRGRHAASSCPAAGANGPIATRAGRAGLRRRRSASRADVGAERGPGRHVDDHHPVGAPRPRPGRGAAPGAVRPVPAARHRRRARRRTRSPTAR